MKKIFKNNIILKIEKKIKFFWEKEKIYEFLKKKKSFFEILDSPPRYTSGDIHFGHMVGYNLLDIICRYKLKRNIFFIFPRCYDTNGLPVEVKVEKELKINPKLEKEKFLKECEILTNKNISLMEKSFNNLSLFLPKKITYLTGNKEFKKFTLENYFYLKKKNLIYESNFPVNWCYRCLSALSESELEKKEQLIENYLIKFEGKNKSIFIQTTAPEYLEFCKLILTKHKENIEYVINPITKKKIKILFDKRVKDFGTKNMMICDYENKFDVEIILEKKIKSTNNLGENGIFINGKIVKGKNKFEARKKIINFLEKKNLLEKKKEKSKKINFFCWRCKKKTIIIDSKEIFLKIINIKKELISFSKKINFFPNYFRKYLENWINSLKWDWIISKKRYWGTKLSENLIFDTWMDSSLTSFFLEKKFNKSCYLRIQSHDIIRTWLFFTLVKAKYLNKIPFKNLIISPFILDNNNKEMHSSDGNVISPNELIKFFGRDSLRYFTTNCKLGQYRKVNYKLIEFGSKWGNKIWNFFNFFLIKNEKMEEKLFFQLDKKNLEFHFKILNFYENYEFDKVIKHLQKFFYKDLIILLEKIKKNNEKIKLKELKIKFCLFLNLISPIYIHLSEYIFSFFIKTSKTIFEINFIEKKL